MAHKMMLKPQEVERMATHEHRTAARFAADYLMYWRLRRLSCPGHFKEYEVERRIKAWVEMSAWWHRINNVR